MAPQLVDGNGNGGRAIVDLRDDWQWRCRKDPMCCALGDWTARREAQTVQRKGRGCQEGLGV